MTGRTLRPVPAVAPRAVAYIRVSKEREDMISPELQQTAISDYCARRGYAIVETLTDLDLTGRFWKRRQVERAVAMIEGGEADVLVVWKLSRVSRNRLDWNIAVDRVESVGGRLESATEPLDATTSTGRFTRGMLAELAAFESEVKGEQWKEAQARRRKNGLPHTGGYRPGYTYEDKGYRPDPDVAPLVVDAYLRYVSGTGFRRVADWLGAVGVPCRSGRWTEKKAQRLLDSGWAAGLLHVHDPACGCKNDGGSCGRRIHIPGAHTPIITDKLWRTYLSERDRRAATPRRLLTPSTTLSGLVRCGACGYGMRVKKRPHRDNPIYQCEHRGCPQPTSVTQRRAIDVARQWLDAYAHDLDHYTAAATEETASRTTAAAAVTRLARAVNALDAELTTLTREYTRGIIPEAAYSSASAQLATERATAERALTEATRASTPRGPSRRQVANVLARWDQIAVADRNRICREALRVVVSRGPWRSTVEAVPAWKWQPPDRS